MVGCVCGGGGGRAGRRRKWLFWGYCWSLAVIFFGHFHTFNSFSFFLSFFLFLFFFFFGGGWGGGGGCGGVYQNSRYFGGIVRIGVRTFC